MTLCEAYGVILGYPKCCVTFFEHNLLLQKRGVRQLTRPLKGTGFVPCPKCAKKSDETLASEINGARMLSIPFPHARGFHNLEEFKVLLDRMANQ